MQKKWLSVFSDRERQNKLWRIMKLTVVMLIGCMITVSTNAQQPQKKEISGTVSDSKGQPIPGATITVKGTTTGTISDSEGKFSLYVPEYAKTFLFSFVGMKSKDVQITDKTTFNVVLVEESIGLDEVVAIGYGTQNRRKITVHIFKKYPDE